MINQEIWDECVKIAAQTWCQPRVEEHEMDADIGYEFANALYHLATMEKDKSALDRLKKFNWNDVQDHTHNGVSF